MTEKKVPISEDPKRKWLLLFIPVCLIMGVLELLRGLSGNSRSWLYVFEWPFFAIFIYYMYWKLSQPLEKYDDSADPKRELEE